MATEINREYKDRLFAFIFGREENKKWTLSLYNAVAGKNFTDPDMIEIYTLLDVLYMAMKNDLAFLILNEIDLFEQQSSPNPNMPVRFLQYLAQEYGKYIKEHGLNKYSKKLLQLPVPRLVVFYNGTDEMPDESILKLSDSFPEGAESDVEVRVRVININHGHNRELLDACRVLKEYSWLIEEVRKNEKEMGIEVAVDKAIKEMPKDFELKPFLEVHRVEVKGMLVEEYNEAETLAMVRAEEREEGREEGRAEGEIIGAIKAYNRMGVSPSNIITNIMDEFELSKDEAEKRVDEVLGLVLA